MRARSVAAVAVVVVVASATTWSLVLTHRGAGFSTAGTVQGGRAFLLVPVAFALLASVGLALRPPGRPWPAFAFALAALAWLAGEWDNPAAGSDVSFSLGLLLYATAPVAVLLAGLSRSGGNLPPRLRQALLVLGTLGTLGIQGLAAAVVFDPASGGCRDCARNLLLVSGDDTALAAIDRWGIRIGLAWAAVTVAVLAFSLFRASPAARRSAGPILVATLAFEGLTLASYAHSWDQGFLGTDDLDHVIWAGQSAALALLAVAAIGELDRERRARRALAGVVIDLSGVAVSTRTLRDALAERFSDPGLVLAYPVDGGARYVDAAAEPVALDHRAGAEQTRLEYAGRHLATVVHPAGALSGRDAAEELVAAIHLGLEHEQLRAQALAQVEDLRASGLRLVETGDAERRRLERDLHDGAQQRLVGLALGLRLWEARAGASPALSEAAGELNAAIADLRSLARGLSPVLVLEAGLAVALRSLAESAPVRLGSVPDARFPAVAESTAYAVVERASTGGPVEVEIGEDDHTLRVSLTGLDGTPSLDDLEDRVTTLGGHLERRGATVCVVLPI